MEQPKLFEAVVIVELEESKATREGPQIRYSFPKGGSANLSLNSVKDFCFPDQEHFEFSKGIPPENFSFALTRQDASRYFGYCLRYRSHHQALCFCIISTFRGVKLFKGLLRHIMEWHDSTFSESALQDLLQTFQDQAYPSPGTPLQVKIHDIFTNVDRELEIPTDDDFAELFNVSTLSTQLTSSQLVIVFSALLVERRIVFCSSDVVRLTKCVEAALALLSPLSWQHIYVPVLPPSLLTYCAAPMPFVVGVLRKSLSTLESLPIEELLVVDLDESSLYLQGSPSSLDIPRKNSVAGNIPSTSGGSTIGSHTTTTTSSSSKKKKKLPVVPSQEDVDTINHAPEFEEEEERKERFCLFPDQISTQLARALKSVRKVNPNTTQLIASGESETAWKAVRKLGDTIAGFYAALFARFRDHFQPGEKSDFDREAFLRRRVGSDMMPFLELFVSSQMFERFVQERRKSGGGENCLSDLFEKKLGLYEAACATNDRWVWLRTDWSSLRPKIESDASSTISNNSTTDHNEQEEPATRRRAPSLKSHFPSIFKGSNDHDPQRKKGVPDINTINRTISPGSVELGQLPAQSSSTPTMDKLKKPRMGYGSIRNFFPGDHSHPDASQPPEPRWSISMSLRPQKKKTRASLTNVMQMNDPDAIPPNLDGLDSVVSSPAMVPNTVVSNSPPVNQTKYEPITLNMNPPTLKNQRKESGLSRSWDKLKRIMK